MSSRTLHSSFRASNLQLTSYVSPGWTEVWAMGPMEQLGTAIAEVAKKVGPSTVGVGNRWRGGSGIVLEKGKVLTNAHNLHGDEVHVYFADGRTVDGSVVGIDGD